MQWAFLKSFILLHILKCYEATTTYETAQYDEHVPNDNIKSRRDDVQPYPRGIYMDYGNDQLANMKGMEELLKTQHSESKEDQLNHMERRRNKILLNIEENSDDDDDDDDDDDENDDSDDDDEDEKEIDKNSYHHHTRMTREQLRALMMQRAQNHDMLTNEMIERHSMNSFESRALNEEMYEKEIERALDAARLAQSSENQDKFDQTNPNKFSKKEPMTKEEFADRALDFIQSKESLSDELSSNALQLRRFLSQRDLNQEMYRKLHETKDESQAAQSYEQIAPNFLHSTTRSGDQSFGDGLFRDSEHHQYVLPHPGEYEGSNPLGLQFPNNLRTDNNIFTKDASSPYGGDSNNLAGALEMLGNSDSTADALFDTFSRKPYNRYDNSRGGAHYAGTDQNNDVTHSRHNVQNLNTEENEMYGTGKESKNKSPIANFGALKKAHTFNDAMTKINQLVDHLESAVVANKSDPHDEIQKFKQSAKNTNINDFDKATLKAVKFAESSEHGYKNSTNPINSMINSTQNKKAVTPDNSSTIAVARNLKIKSAFAHLKTLKESNKGNSFLEKNIKEKELNITIKNASGAAKRTFTFYTNKIPVLQVPKELPVKRNRKPSNIPKQGVSEMAKIRTLKNPINMKDYFKGDTFKRKYLIYKKMMKES